MEDEEWEWLEYEWEVECEELRPRAEAATENRTTTSRIVSVCFMRNALSRRRMKGKLIVGEEGAEKQIPRRVRPSSG